MKNPFRRSKDKKDDDSNWIWLYVLGVLAIAGFVNAAMYLPIPTLETLKANDWLSFWGGYLGGVLGCIPAFAALRESRRQAKQQHEEVQAQLEESHRQAEQMQFDSFESRRCSVMPIVDFYFLPIYDYPEELPPSEAWFLMREDLGISKVSPIKNFTKDFFEKSSAYFYFFTVKNIGPGTALEAKITADGVVYFDGDVATTSVWNSILMITSQEATNSLKQFDFKLEYYDVFSNLYERECSVKFGKGGLRVIKTSSPKLVHRCENPLC